MKDRWFPCGGGAPVLESTPLSEAWHACIRVCMCGVLNNCIQLITLVGNKSCDGISRRFAASYSVWQLLQIRTLFRKGYQFKSRQNTFTIVNSDPLWMGYIFLEAAIEINASHDPWNWTAEWRYWRTGAIHFHLQNPNCWKVLGRQEKDLFFKWSLAFVCLRHPVQYLILLPPGVPFTGLFNLKVGK